MSTEYEMSLMTTDNAPIANRLSKPFWVVWSIELWERFGYYGMQAILSLYFVQQLGYTEKQSFYIYGSFTAFAYGFIWIGGWIGDHYLGAKRTLTLGAVILMLSYAALALSNQHTIFYALAGIVVGNSLFKANPSSLISKMYAKNDTRLDSAMTLYYMAINVGSMLSMAVTPIIAKNDGWPLAFLLCALGLLLGLGNYFIYRRVLQNINTPADQESFNYKRFGVVIFGSLLVIGIISQLLSHTTICDWIVYSVVTMAFVYYLKLAFSSQQSERARMLVAFVLMLQGMIFFVLYNQMPTSLTFFALHNINNHFFGWTIPAAEYQVLNPIIIVLVSPVLAWFYQRSPATHVTKFCWGMSLCALAFLVLAIPQYTVTNGFISPAWMVLTYFLQSTGELLISGLGLAMVAELCPRKMSGYVMGVWWLANMLAGPIGAWVGGLTAVSNASAAISSVASLHIYGDIFGKIGMVIGLIAMLMWICRPLLNDILILNQFKQE